MPAELERIIVKCLEKDRELRYQRASEIRADLQRLKQDLGLRASHHCSAANTGLETLEHRAVRGCRDSRFGRGSLLLLAARPNSQAQTHGQRHDRSGGFHEQDRRRRFRPDTAPGISGGTGSIAIFEPRPGSANTRNAASDGPPGKHAGYWRRGARDLRAHIQRCRRGRVDLQTRKTNMSWDARNELPYGRSALRRAGTGRQRKEDVLNALSQMARKFRTKAGESPRDGQRACDSAGRGDHAVARSVETVLRRLEAGIIGEQCRRGSASPAGHSNRSQIRHGLCIPGRAFTAIPGSLCLAAESIRKAYELRDRATRSRNVSLSTFNYHKQVTGNLEKAQRDW